MHNRNNTQKTIGPSEEIISAKKVKLIAVFQKSQEKHGLRIP
jgi:hypothetical protein